MSRALLAAALAACLPLAAEAAPCDRDRERETRYWSTPGQPEARHSGVLAAFKRAHPCPSTGASAGPCPISAQVAPPPPHEPRTAPLALGAGHFGDAVRPSVLRMA